MTTDELRAKFEATISSIDPKTFRQCFSLETDSNGDYKDEAISGLWNGFLLGRASRDAEAEALRKDAERYRAVEKLAHKETAYDRYGNGAHWNIGLFGEDSRMTFAEAIDAAMQEKQP